MPGIGIDLNSAPPESSVNHPIDWDSIGEWDGPAHELDYAMVWDDGNQVTADGVAEILALPTGVQSSGTADGHRQGAGGDPVAAAADASHTVNEGGTGVQAAAANVQQGAPGHGGSNNNRRRFYSDELKIAIYLELLAKTDPPILRRGVSKAVAEKFDVPLRVVQYIWKNGQEGGINGVVNIDGIKLVAEVHCLTGIWQYIYSPPFLLSGVPGKMPGNQAGKISLRILFRSNSDAIYGIRTCLHHSLTTSSC